jgi:hypothetical protein
MSKWIEQLEAVINKKETRPAGNWNTKLEITDIIKCSNSNCVKFLRWCEETKKVKKIIGTSLTSHKVLTSKVFYNPNKKNWKVLYYEYAKTKEKRPVGQGWKTFTQLCRDLKINEQTGRRALSLLTKSKKLEIFKGGIIDQSSRVTAIKFYRLKE